MSHPAAPCDHSWEPFGPPPRFRDYLPEVRRCSGCEAYQFETGQPVPADSLTSVRPYPPPEPGEPTGWTSWKPTE